MRGSRLGQSQKIDCKGAGIAGQRGSGNIASYDGKGVGERLRDAKQAGVGGEMLYEHRLGAAGMRVDEIERRLAEQSDEDRAIREDPEVLHPRPIRKLMQHVNWGLGFDGVCIGVKVKVY